MTDRESIVRFLETEAAKFDKAAEYAMEGEDEFTQERLLSKASILRTIAAYVARGDDLRGE